MAQKSSPQSIHSKLITPHRETSEFLFLTLSKQPLLNAGVSP